MDASLVEENILLLNVVRCHQSCVRIHRNTTEQSAIQFLSLDQIMTIAHRTQELFMQMCPVAVDDAELSVTHRLICNIECLMRDVHHCPPTKWSDDQTPLVHTYQSVDETIMEIMGGWSTLPTATIASRLRSLTGFLSHYGTFQVLPLGVHPETMSCFFCRYEEAMNDYSADILHVCQHYLTEKLSGPKPPTVHFKQVKEGASIKDDGWDIVEWRNITVSTKFRLNQERQKRDKIKTLFRSMERKFEKLNRDTEYILSLKCVSPYMYTTIARLVLFLKRRISTLEMFSPSRGSAPICHALRRAGIGDIGQCIQRLELVLEKIVLTKGNKRHIHDLYERMLLDPVSLYCNTDNVLRTSILAKKHQLAQGHTAEDIHERYEHLCRRTFKESAWNCKTSDRQDLDVLYDAVSVITTFNMWLSTVGVSDKHCMEILRAEKDARRRGSVSFLYDYGQLGYCWEVGDHQMTEPTVNSSYQKTLDLCLLHLTHLYRSELIKWTVTVREVLKGQKSQPTSTDQSS